MNYLEDLRGIHEGEEIWAVGAGSSLDGYPLDFFEGKICIGVNWVFSVFLNVGDGLEKFKYRTFYSVHSHAEHAYWIAKHIPHFLTSCFFISRPPAHRIFCGRPYCCPEDFNDDPYWIRNSYQHRDVKATDADFVALAKCIMAERTDCRYRVRGTTLHWAIEVAVVLGAKKIYVVGAEARGDHMSKHGSLYTAAHPSLGTGRKHIHMLTGTRCLAKVFKPYGIEIVTYNCGKEEQKS